MNKATEWMSKAKRRKGSIDIWVKKGLNVTNTKKSLCILLVVTCKANYLLLPNDTLNYVGMNECVFVCIRPYPRSQFQTITNKQKQKQQQKWL